MCLCWSICSLPLCLLSLHRYLTFLCLNWPDLLIIYLELLYSPPLTFFWLISLLHTHPLWEYLGWGKTLWCFLIKAVCFHFLPTSSSIPLCLFFIFFLLLSTLSSEGSLPICSFIIQQKCTFKINIYCQVFAYMWKGRVTAFAYLCYDENVMCSNPTAQHTDSF